MALAVKLAEPGVHHSHTLWVGSFCNSPELAQIVKSKGTDFVGTVHGNRKNVPPFVIGKQNKKRKKYKSILLSIPGYIIIWPTVTRKSYSSFQTPDR
jgi:hypothetical protein